MHRLELKIPPPLVFLACAGIAWALRALAPGLAFSRPWVSGVAASLAILGGAVAALAVSTVLRVGTTVHPHRPSRSTVVVTRGLYGFTRNPMYLGLALILTSFSLWLAHPLSLLSVPVFIAYITRFQIVPEERALLAKFGEPYTEYLKSVRRWI